MSGFWRRRPTSGMMAQSISPGGDPSIRMPFPALRSRRQRARAMGDGAAHTIAHFTFWTWAPPHRDSCCSEIRSRMSNVDNNPDLRPLTELPLRNQLGAKARELLICNRSRFLQPIEFFDLISDAKADGATDLIARLPRLLAVSLGHAVCLSD